MSRSRKDKPGGHRCYDRGKPSWRARICNAQARARERDHIRHERYDLIGSDRADHHHAARWDWW